MTDEKKDKKDEQEGNEGDKINLKDAYRGYEPPGIQVKIFNEDAYERSRQK